MNQSHRNFAVPCIVQYLGELQTTCKCKKLEKKGPKSTHPTVYTCIILSTPYKNTVVHHAADRCAVILIPAFWGNSPRNKDEGELLLIYIVIYSLVSPVQFTRSQNDKTRSSKVRIFFCFKKVKLRHDGWENSKLFTYSKNVNL